MRTRRSRSARGARSLGGASTSTTANRYIPKAWVYTPAPAPLALLRATWAKRDALTERERSLVFSLLRQIERTTLTERQLEAARSIGAAVGVGYDDPAYDYDATPLETSVPAVQPWGPLPLKPPRRAA